MNEVDVNGEPPLADTGSKSLKRRLTEAGMYGTVYFCPTNYLYTVRVRGEIGIMPWAEPHKLSGEYHRLMNEVWVTYSGGYKG